MVFVGHRRNARTLRSHRPVPEKGEEMSALSRRTVLRAGAVGAAAAAVAGSLPASPAHAARTDIGVLVHAFPLGAVTLLAGPFLSNTGRTQSYLSFLDADRLLHTFRLNYGLSSSATACG